MAILNTSIKSDGMMRCMFSFLNRYFMARAVFNDEHEQPLLLNYFSEVPSGFFLDIGANTPDNAVTRCLWPNWTGVVVEPLPELASLFKTFEGLKVYEAAVTNEINAQKKFAKFWRAGKQSTLDHSKLMDVDLITNELFVRLTTVNKILVDEHVNRVDFLSVDVEGGECDVLEDVNLSALGVRLVLVEDWGRSFHLHRMMGSKGYKRVRRTGFNSWYVPNNVKFSVSTFGHLQLFRKYILSMPFKNFRRWRHRN